MTCEQMRQFLDAYVDDELDIATALEIQEHLPGCPACRMAMESMQIVLSSCLIIILTTVQYAKLHLRLRIRTCPDFDFIKCCIL